MTEPHLLLDPDAPAPAASPGRPAARRTAPLLRLASLAAIGVAVYGLLAHRLVVEIGLARPLANNVYFRLFALFEQPFIVMLLLFALVALFVRGDGDGRPLAPPARAVAALALGALVLTAIAAVTVLHSLPLSMDEYSTDFQARIFASGRIAAPVPVEWRGMVDAIIPIFSGYDAQHGTWLSQYLPAYAALRAPFVLVGAGTLLNPLLAAAALLLLARVARRLWPGDGERQWAALLALATSSQFLLISASAYSMPAHLALNLLWLLLWLRGDRGALLAAPWVGVLALGLHNPFPHALFVTPFLFRLLRQRRAGWFAYMSAVYLAGAAAWLAWLHAVHPAARSAGGLLSLFGVPSAVDLWVHGINVVLLLTWQTPLAALAMVAGIFAARRLEPVMRDVALGALATFVFYLFFPGTQGHGWGYRYMYSVLGNLALIAGAGWGLLREAGTPRLRPLAIASLVMTLAIQLPLRAVQAESFVRPFAESMAWLQAQPADVVIVPIQAWWYGRDLQRNDPLMKARPVIVGAPWLTQARYEELVRRYPGRVRIVAPAELLQFGMTPWPRPAAETDAPR